MNPKQTMPKRPPAKVRLVPARERSTDFNDARFTMRTVIAIILATVSIVGSQWAFSNSLQTAIVQLGARMDAKDTIDKRDTEASDKEVAAEKRIVEEWRSQIDKRIDQVERDYKLADYDLKTLINGKR